MLVRIHQSYSVTIYIVSEPEAAATNVLMPCGRWDPSGGIGRIIAYKKEIAVRRVNNYIIEELKKIMYKH